ncbi:MAG: hypothetical protein NTY74_13640 [Ignavibacteriae bacterium]|nr:hypothetical protein [Ignavibacteriota bacterium]
MKLLIFYIIIIVLFTISCKENKPALISDTVVFKDSLIIKSDTLRKSNDTNIKVKDYEIINTETCMDGNSPTIGYLKIGKNIPTAKIIPHYKTPYDFMESLLSVSIFDSSSGRQIQKISPHDVYPRKGTAYDTVTFTEIHFDYYNFDDYMDIFILQTCGAHGPCYGFYFLYDKNKGKYVYAKEYSSLFEISVDKKKKLIYDCSSSGNGYWTYRTYELKGNKPYLIEDESLIRIDTDHNSELFRYVRRLRNSQGKFVKVEVFDTSQFIGPKYFKED